jgi:UDP-N-acetylglucosamine diphosphorylase/glucosamine-1-phosphate N-acetyltransferase
MADVISFILFDTPERVLLYPFTYTRSIAEIRLGILTIKDRWELLLKEKVQILSADYLQEHYPSIPGGKKILINATVFANEPVAEAIIRLEDGEALLHNNMVLAFCSSRDDIRTMNDIRDFHPMHTTEYTGNIASIKYPWDIVQLNGKAIAGDFQLLAAAGKSCVVAGTNRVMGEEHIFIEEGAVVEHCMLNATGGPIYIGRNATVMEGSVIRGPFAMGEGAVVKMGTAIYGATSIGPHCIAGGEIKNSIMMGYSNKAHFGYLGDAVIGEWCNLGAGTSNSNVKNSASDILVEMPGNGMVNAGLKCGLMMGDYSRCAIHTSFNTATFVGIACNIFGEGLTPKHVPGFSWGYAGRYAFDKAIEHIQNWKKLKNQIITERETRILEYLYKQLS